MLAIRAIAKMYSKLGFLVAIIGVQLTSTLGNPEPPRPREGKPKERDSSSEEEPVAIPMPKVPVGPNCLGSGFPGTPGWNACFEKFQTDMQTFQNEMKEYSQRVTDANTKKENSQTSKDGVKYTTSISSQGYTIRTSGIAVTTKTRDSVISIKLAVGDFEGYEKRVEGKEILLNIDMGEGKKKYAAVKVPKGVNLSEVKVDMTSDSIIISGPAKTGSGGFETSHSSSSSGGIHSSSSSFSGGGGIGFGRSFKLGNPEAIPEIPSPPSFNSYNYNPFPFGNPPFGNPYIPPIPYFGPMWF